MRVALVSAMVAGCSFSAQVAPSDATNDRSLDAPVAPSDAANDRSLDAQVDAVASCPATYNLHFGGHSYRKTAAPTDYPGVVSDCNDGRGYVVAIDASDEDTWVKNQFGSSGYIWIGLQFESPGYRWNNHVPLGTYNNFMGGTVPAAPADPCVDKSLSPSTGGAWEPFTCTQQHQSLCECDAP
jgi:hypothetical protein